MPAEVADADDRDAQSDQPARCSLRGRPTIAMPASFADVKTRVAVEHQRPPRVDRQRRRAGGPHRLDGRDADDRHVESHVLFRLGHLDDPHAGPGQVTGAADHFVGAFHRLDGNDGLVLDRDRLPDVERRNSVGHAVAECEVVVLLFDRGLRSVSVPAPASSGCRNAVESSSSMPSPRITSATAEISASVLRAFSRVSTESSVKSGTMPEKIFDVLDLPGHHRLGHAGGFQNLDALAQLAERYPVKVGVRISRGRLEIGKGFFLDRHDGHVVPEAASPLQRQKGKPAVAGNEADSAHAVRRRQLLEQRDDRSDGERRRFG